MADEGYLRRVYDIEDPREVRDYYDTWADTYDAELRANGYVTPERIAAALASLAADTTVPVLDYGCGTGLSGQALVAAGFTTVDGADPSREMLRVAAGKGIYRELVHLDLDAARPPFDDASYAVVTAVGLIGPGAAPLGLFDQLLALVAPGGLFGLSFNAHALADPAFPARIREHVEAGATSVEFSELGHHLPGIGTESVVYVLRRTASAPG